MAAVGIPTTACQNILEHEIKLIASWSRYQYNKKITKLDMDELTARASRRYS